MTKIINFIVEKRALFSVFFAFLFVASLISIPFTEINYDDTRYLPELSDIRSALNKNGEEFGSGTAAPALLRGADTEEILKIKARIKATDGISGVIWLDDIFLALADNTKLSDEKAVDYILRAFRALPQSEEATPYTLALALKNEFTEEESEDALPLLQSVISKGFGENIDLASLIELTKPLPEENISYITELKAQAGEVLNGKSTFFPAFINALVGMNMNNTALTAEKAANILFTAVSALPLKENLTAYDIYSSLSQAISPEELPLAIGLLSAFGFDLSFIDTSNPQAMASPLPESVLTAISGAKEQLSFASKALSGENAAVFYRLADTVVALNASGKALTGESAAQYFSRLARVLPSADNTTGYDIISAISGEFTQSELPVVFALIEGMGSNAFLPGLSGVGAGDTAQLSALSSPLGSEYERSIQGLNSEITSFLKDGNALFTVIFTEDDYSVLTGKAIKKITALHEKLYISGNAAAAYYAKENQTAEIIKASVMVIIVGLAVLFLFSSSWFDPVLYILVTVVAIVINLGTNVMLDSVSYLSESVVCVLQLALTIDYAVFLISRYKKERGEGKDAKSAIKEAMRRSFSAISASSLTTVVCFITIMFMKYRLGLDMGMVMAKGILLSLLTVFLLLPGLIVYFDKQIVKAEHKTFAFGCTRLSRISFKHRFLIGTVAIALIAGSAFFAGKNTFTFASSAFHNKDSEAIISRKLTEEVFGTQEQLVLLVPKDGEKELMLSKALAETNGVSGVSGAALIAESGFEEIIPDIMKAQLTGKNGYNRIVLLLDCEEEGEETKELLSLIRSETEKIYGSEEYYLLGNTVAALDMEANTTNDFARISAYSLIAVALIVAFSFRSALIPVILVAVIQGSVWLNMSIPYLAGDKLIFLGYMIITNVLLGATIDYAILLTSNYMEAREKNDIPTSVREAQSHSLRSILTSGTIFTLGGLILGIMSSFPTVQLLGYAIMRGGLCSIILTIFALPALLAIFDKPIRFLTKRAKRADNR